MKKIFILVIALAMIVVSCQTDAIVNKMSPNAEATCEVDTENYYDLSQTEMLSEANEEAFRVLNEELRGLSEIYPSECQLRAGFRRWFLLIVGGDMIGAAIGACLGNPILGAILGSLKGAAVAAGLNTNDRYVPQRQNADPNMNVSTIVGNAEYAGYIHNLIIYDVYRELGPYFENYTNEELMECIASKAFYRMGKPISETMSFYANSTYHSMLNRSLYNYNLLPSEHIFLDIASEYPTITNEIETICIFGNQYSEYTNQTTKDNYTESFVDIVKNSNLGLNSKNFIISVVKIANYSERMWVLASE